LLEYLNSITESIDQGIPVDVIYLDFAKAFDKVPHKRLLQKFQSHGIKGHVAAWINEWFSEERRRL
jgi:hypothetical protein